MNSLLRQSSRPAWVVLLALASLGGCNSSGTAPPPPPTLTGVTIAAASPSVPVGESELFVATAHYSDGSTADVTSQASWSSTPAGVVSVTSGIVSGVVAGSATITASFDGMDATGQVTVTPAGPTNEPAGFTPFTEHYFNTLMNTDGAGIGPWSGGNGVVSIVNDPTAPKSPPSVGQWTYPAGFQAGSSPGMIEFDDLNNSTQLYLSFWMKLSPNFEGQSSQTNKVLFFWIDNHPAVFLSNQGTGTTAPLVPTVRYQGAFDPRAYFNQNVGTQQAMTRGQWRKWELVLMANTPGQANGIIRWWIDGQKVGEYTDVSFRDTAIPFQYLFLQPIWGGTSGTVAAEQYLWVDHLYLSGHP